MEKKESPKNDVSITTKPPIPGISRRAFGIIKFILGILFLPFVYSVSVAFLNEFSIVEKSLQRQFWAGTISFLIVYLFIWEPARIYSRGQKILEVIFRFFAPLVRVAPYLLPIYFILIFIGYSVLSLVFNFRHLLDYFLFLFGFSLTLHLVFSAKSIRAKQGDFLRANYIFGFSLIYIINLIILSFCLNLTFEKFSLVNFFNNSFQVARDVFGSIFKQLFLS